MHSETNYAGSIPFWESYLTNCQQVIDDLSEAISNIIKNVEEREKTAKPLTEESFNELM